MDDDVAVDVLSAARHSLGLTSDEPLAPAELLDLLRREKLPLLWMVADTRLHECKMGGAVAQDGHSGPHHLSMLESKEFRDALEEDRQRFSHLHGEYVRLVERWEDAGVQCVCFKSAGIAPSFPYAGDDVDILVPTSQVERAHQALRDLGYIAMPTVSDHFSQQFRRFEAGRGDAASIHLHVRASGEIDLLLDDEIWSRARPSHDDRWTWIPGREDVVLITVAHALLQKNEISLRSLLRIRQALRDGALDWAYMDHVATERGWRTCLHFGLLLVAHLEEQFFDWSTVPTFQREQCERTLRDNVWCRRYWEKARHAPPTLPFDVPQNLTRLLLAEKLWRDLHPSLAGKSMETVRTVVQSILQRTGRHRQYPMLISLSGMDGGGKSSLIHVLHAAFGVAHVRSRIVWMRMGYTRSLAILRLRRRRTEQRTGKAAKPALSRNATGWRLAGWAIAATVDYAAWLQYVRWCLWCGDVVIADRYLYDFAVDLSSRLEAEPRLAEVLLRFLRWLAPQPERAYLVHVDPALSLLRKPGDFQDIGPVEQHARFEAAGRHYGLRFLDGSRPFDEVANALVHDVMNRYVARPRLLRRALCLGRVCTLRSRG